MYYFSYYKNPLSNYIPEDIITNVPNLPSTFKSKIHVCENNNVKLKFRTIDVIAEKIKAKKQNSKNRLSTEEIRENMQKKKIETKNIKIVPTKKVIITRSIIVENKKKIPYLLFDKDD